ncbi:hypothetical protein PPTG_24162 [Phytophthora nicotianae INRA-310]|uniref:Uncharacterized protein n=1 Tax=Phytophthora nicotianae (strain INRA-310) TaxID=761204 RepID=W2PJ25_PHYN3|nr:hypothetical protein PPTG_24162 [Phytophthora nicotianae INRA-310]ETN01013.1 hypothetical protein PPTG_24162 [Phytophthora nicotianae INRA-310]
MGRWDAGIALYARAVTPEYPPLHPEVAHPESRSASTTHRSGARITTKQAVRGQTSEVNSRLSQALNGRARVCE